MIYRPRLKVYKNYNGSNWFNPETMTAISYGWWVYLKEINGKLVFNDYRYSVTTSKHQAQLRNLIGKVDHVIHAPYGLQDLGSSIEYYNYQIKTLTEAIEKPRSHKRKNEERMVDIKLIEKDIETVKELMAS